MIMECIKDAFKKKEKYSSFRFDFCGYDGTLWCEPREDGDMIAVFFVFFYVSPNSFFVQVLKNLKK